MLKQTITFSDLDGNDVTEDFYFNLSTAELAEMELSRKGGLTTYLDEIIEAEDGASIINTFKQILSMSVGKRSEDGRRFIKSKEITDAFMMSDAYTRVFMDVLADGNKAAEFIRGIVPQDVEARLESGKSVVDIELPEPKQPSWVTEGRTPTPAELKDASPEELREAFRRKSAE